MSALVKVVDSDPDVIPNRKVHYVALYYSYRLDLQIRIHH